MTSRLAVLAMVTLSVAVPVAAQESLARSTPSDAVVTSVALVLPKDMFSTAAWTAEPDGMERSFFSARPASRIRNDTVAQAPRKSKAPVVGGMLLGALAGFLGGNYVQQSFCEYDCGPGGFTWAFTAAGAAGGAAIGAWLR